MPPARGDGEVRGPAPRPPSVWAPAGCSRARKGDGDSDGDPRSGSVGLVVEVSSQLHQHSTPKKGRRRQGGLQAPDRGGDDTGIILGA
jgi:hypothetical protein